MYEAQSQRSKLGNSANKFYLPHCAWSHPEWMLGLEQHKKTITLDLWLFVKLFANVPWLILRLHGLVEIHRHANWNFSRHMSSLFCPSKINGGNLSGAPLSCTPNYTTLNTQTPFYSGFIVHMWTYLQKDLGGYVVLGSVHTKSKHVIKFSIIGYIDILIT